MCNQLLLLHGRGVLYTCVLPPIFFFFLFTKIKITSLVFFSLSLSSSSPSFYSMMIIWPCCCSYFPRSESRATSCVRAPTVWKQRDLRSAGQIRWQHRPKSGIVYWGFFPTCICRYTRRERLFLIHPSRHRDTGFGIPRAPVASSTWSERPPIRTRLNTLFLVFVRIIACVL